MRKALDIRKLALARIRKQLSQEKSKRDLIIGKVVDSIDTLNKTINSLYIRLATWYSLYFPELWQNEKDLEKFVKIVYKEGYREQIKKYGWEKSIGGDFPKEDIEEMRKLAELILELIKEKEHLEDYLKKLMNEICPNISEVAGEKIGAKLIRRTGSLRKLVKFPSSTIQVLGAEKALFVHLKRKRVPPPKHGYIYLHPLVKNAPKKIRGNVARKLANKIAIAARVDYFNKEKFIGKELKKELLDEYNKLLEKYKRDKNKKKKK